MYPITELWNFISVVQFIKDDHFLEIEFLTANTGCVSKPGQKVTRTRHASEISQVDEEWAG
jgi:hypothetical protein